MQEMPQPPEVEISTSITVSVDKIKNAPDTLSNPSVVSWIDPENIKICFQLVLFSFEPPKADSQAYIKKTATRIDPIKEGDPIIYQFDIPIITETSDELSMVVIDGSIPEGPENVQLHFNYPTKDSNGNPTTTPRGTISIPKGVSPSS